MFRWRRPAELAPAELVAYVSPPRPEFDLVIPLDVVARWLMWLQDDRPELVTRDLNEAIADLGRAKAAPGPDPPSHPTRPDISTR